MRQERIAKYQGMNLYVKNLADDVEDDQVRGKEVIVAEEASRNGEGSQGSGTRG